jgi:hypothetical protein
MPLLARSLITFVIGMTLVGSNVADWNQTHIFSEMWSPHARFHGAWFVFAVSFLSVLSLWLLWSRDAQPDRSRIAAYVQGCIWLAFFPSMLVPEMLLADPGKEVKLAGIDLNLLGSILNVALLGIALVLLPRNR